jgi:zinc protease
MSLFFLLFLQIIPIPQLPDPDGFVNVGGEIVGPYILREDSGQTTKVILKNGLTVLIRENNAVALTSVTTHVKAGYFDEPDSVSGIAHVVEHMFFKGTGRRVVGQIARETKALGGSLNAYTNYERTVYQTVVPSDNAVQALDIQSDALFNPTFDAGELAREIEVVLQENNRKLDKPRAVAVERLYATSFEEHRMRRWRIGSPEQLRALTREDVADFYQAYYQPSNIILAVVGQFDREEMLDHVVRFYGDRSDTPVERDRGPVEPLQSTFRYNWERGPIEYSHVALGFHVPDRLSSDAYVLDVLSAILTAGRASRMNQFLRDELGVIHSATSSFVGFDGLGYFQLRLETSAPLEAEVAALGEIERVQRFGVRGAELARAQTLIAQEYYQSLETVESLADEMARQEALGDWRRMDLYLEGIQAVRREDIQRLAREYLTRTNMGVFEYLPNGVTRSFSNDDFAANVLDRIPVDIVERSAEEFTVRVSVPKPDVEVVLDLVRPVVRRQILRGPEVYVLEDHRLPLVSFGIFYPGGRLYETERNAGITELMLRSALRGTRRYNTADISRRLENAGARIEVVNDPDFFGYVLEGVSGQIDEALEILVEVLQDPTFPEAQVAQELALQEARISKLREDNLRYPVQLFMETAFDGHSYARSAVGTASSLNVLTADDLNEWHRLHQRTLVPLIVIVGDTNGTGLVASIAETLTNEDLNERDISRLPVPAVALEREERIETAPRRQSAMVYGTIGPQLSHRDRLPLIVIENVLSGLGGRLFESIREEQGLAYTVRVFDNFLSRSGVFFAYTAFSLENEEQVRASLEAEIVLLVEEGITDEELERAISYSIGAHEISLQTRRGRTLAFARAVISGDGMSAVIGFSEAIRQVTRDQVRAMAVKYLSPSLAKIVILRGED